MIFVSMLCFQVREGSNRHGYREERLHICSERELDGLSVPRLSRVDNDR